MIATIFLREFHLSVIITDDFLLFHSQELLSLYAITQWPHSQVASL